MQANSTGVAAIHDPAELAYARHRSALLRRQWIAISAVLSVALSLVSWKVARHVTASLWLQANQYDVHWLCDKDLWKQGGYTVVRFSPRNYYFMGDRPLLDLRYLKDLHRLQDLDLSALSGMRDAELTGLGELTTLKVLDLDRSRQSPWSNVYAAELTDATLAQIGRLSGLEILKLGSHKVTDVGLKQLVGLDHLRTLDLENTEISDAGLEWLKDLPALKSLDLSGTKVTSQGVADFAAARPLVHVLSDTPAPVPDSKTPR